MMSSIASRIRSSTMGHTRNNATAAATFFTTNHTCLTPNQSAKAMPSTLNRTFSSNGGAYNGTPLGPLRSTPSYAIFGEKTMVSIKMIPPVFRSLRNGSLVLDQNKKGRILLEWSARGVSGGFDRESQIRFGLSPEEVGFLLHQLPENEVEFVRRLPADQPGTMAADMPEKVLRITPGEGGQFSFKIDYEKNNVGGQVVGGETEPLGPLEVVLQLGEYVVMRKMMELSLPSLIGWDVQTNFAIQNSMNIAMQAGASGQPTARSRPTTEQPTAHEEIPPADL